MKNRAALLFCLMFLAIAPQAFAGTRTITIVNTTPYTVWATFLHDYTLGRDQTGTKAVDANATVTVAINNTTNYLRTELHTGNTVHCDTTAEAGSNRTKYTVHFQNGKCWIVAEP